jgi:hypothetical protein
MAADAPPLIHEHSPALGFLLAGPAARSCLPRSFLRGLEHTTFWHKSYTHFKELTLILVWWNSYLAWWQPKHSNLLKDSLPSWQFPVAQVAHALGTS